MADHTPVYGEGDTGSPRALAPRVSAGRTDIDLFAEDAIVGEATESGAQKSHVSPVMLLRYKWSILLITLLVGGASAPAIWLSITPSYRARGVIRVAPIVSRVLYRSENNTLVPLYDAYLNTQVSVIKSPKVFQRVLDREDVRKTAWYDEKPGFSLGEPPSRLERLVETLSVMPRRGTELIDVAASTYSGADAKVLVDAVLDEYKKYTDESAAETDTERWRTLVSRKQTLKNEIDNLMQLKNDVAKRLGTSAPDLMWEESGAALNALETERNALVRQRELASWDLASLGPAPEPPPSDSSDDDLVDESEPAPLHFADDPEWRARKLELDAAEYELYQARQQYGDLHPRISQLQAKVDHRAEILRERESQLQERAALLPIQTAPVPNTGVAILDRAALQRQLKRLDRNIELLDQELTAQRTKVDSIADVSRNITTWDEEIRLKRADYETTRARLEELEVEGKAPARISISAYAVQPSRPDKDRRIFLSAFAVFAAMMLGLAIAYLRLVFDSRIREIADVQGAVRGPFLGQLPPLLPMADLMADRDPLIMENVRIVRTAMLERLRGKRNSVVLITSSSARAGKTSVAVLLARSLAQLGKRTLLVEADLRRPALSQNLKLDSRAGLAALLSGAIDEKDLMVPTDLENLDLVPAGARPDEFNAELLANGVFTECLGRWRKAYDFVLLDSPPVPVVADARILAAHADGTVLVLRSAHCRRAEVMRTYLDLQAGGSLLLGTILVGGHTHGHYGYYGYDSYGSYRDTQKALTTG